MPQPSDRFIPATVFVTGAAVLVLEILGTRLLSPSFGNNIYVWSALIAVTMVALAGGYCTGGILADRRGEPLLLDLLLAAAAVWVAVTPALVTNVSELLYSIEFRLAILATAAVAFGPALFLLGMVTPVAVRLTVRDVSHVGRSSGNVYAWSSIGGVSGALTAGFVLFPLVGISTICTLLAVGLVALALSRWLTRTRIPWLGLVPPLLLGAIPLATPNWYRPAQSWTDGNVEVLANRPSFYGTVRVAVVGGFHALFIDGLCHNARTEADAVSVMPHIHLMGMLPYLYPEGQTALVIGLGGGDLVRLLSSHGVRSTAVEIDPVVVDAARHHFGLEQDVRVAVADGRFFLRRNHERFDFLVVDAFQGGSVPIHLFSKEAFAEMKQDMSPDGLLAVNIVVQGHASRFIDDLVTTVGSIFPQLLLASSNSDPGALGNVVLFASRRPILVPGASQETGLPDSFAGRVIDHRSRKGVLITDERNLVDTHSAEAEIALRHQANKMLPRSLLRP